MPIATGYPSEEQMLEPSLIDILGDTSGILSNLDLISILEKLARALDTFIRIDGISLKINDLTEELLLVKREEVFKKEIVYGSRLITPSSFAHYVLSSKQPLVIEDISRETRFTYPTYIKREGFESLVSVPLVSGGRCFGLVTMYLKRTSQIATNLIGMVSIVASVAAAAVENSQLVRQIEKNYFSTVEALAAAIEAKDPYTRGHSKRVTQFAIALAERFGVSGSELTTLQYGATLHDIGKIGISGTILNKPDKLTEQEYQVIKQHPVIGEKVIAHVDFLQGARAIVRSHHERFDGTGYPDGLRDEEIPFLARIVAVADFFDALTSDRPYRKAYSIEQTMLMIKQGIGKEFDPLIAREFIAINRFAGGQAKQELLDSALRSL